MLRIKTKMLFGPTVTRNTHEIPMMKGDPIGMYPISCGASIGKYLMQNKIFAW